MTIVSAPGPGGRSIEIDDELLRAHEHALGAAPAQSREPVRLAFAAAHVVMRPSYAAVAHSLESPGEPAEIGPHVDWDATARVRRHLDRHGFGIAEAMDTAQRFSIGWPIAERLIRACGALGLRNGFVAGAGVDHLPRIESKRDLVDGVVHQANAIRDAGGIVMLLPLPWLSQNQCPASDYVEVYGAIVRELDGPLFVHWLGEMFLPALRGYFPDDSFRAVMALDPDKVRGCKLSLLDDALELAIRRELAPRDQIVLTGDDLHFANLIRGGDPGDPDAPIATAAAEQRVDLAGRPVPIGDFSHALLGVFDGIARPAGVALRALAHGDAARYASVMRPCERLGQHLFAPPTQHYKAGLAFLAWLDGLQDDFLLVNHEQRARDREHYLRAAELAARAGVFGDATRTAARLEAFAARSG